MAGRISPVERCLVIGEPELAERVVDKLRSSRAHATVVASLPLTDHDLDALDSPESMRALVSELRVHRLILAPASGDDAGRLAADPDRQGGRRAREPPAAHVRGGRQRRAVRRRRRHDDGGRPPVRAAALVAAAQARVRPRRGLAAAADRRAGDGRDRARDPARLQPARCSSGSPAWAARGGTSPSSSSARWSPTRMRRRTSCARATRPERGSSRSRRPAHHARRTVPAAQRRSTSCPQLLNVLRGEMSLVGPRPAGDRRGRAGLRPRPQPAVSHPGHDRALADPRLARADAARWSGSTTCTSRTGRSGWTSSCCCARSVASCAAATSEPGGRGRVSCRALYRARVPAPAVEETCWCVPGSSPCWPWRSPRPLAGRPRAARGASARRGGGGARDQAPARRRRAGLLRALRPRPADRSVLLPHRRLVRERRGSARRGPRQGRRAQRLCRDHRELRSRAGARRRIARVRPVERAGSVHQRVRRGDGGLGADGRDRHGGRAGRLHGASAGHRRRAAHRRARPVQQLR